MDSGDVSEGSLIIGVDFVDLESVLEELSVHDLLNNPNYKFEPINHRDI